MKKFVFSMILIFLLFIQIFAQKSDFIIDDPAKEIFDSAMSYYRSNDMLRAKDSFLKLIDKYSNSSYARQSYFYLGKVFKVISKEELEKSISFFKNSALAFSGTDVEKSSLKELAAIYREFGQREKLVNTLKRLINTFPASIDMMSVYMELSRLVEDNDEKAKVLETYLDNFEDAPDKDKIKNTLFEYYVQNKDIDKASDIWRNIDKSLLPAAYSVDYLIEIGDWSLAMDYIDVLEKQDEELAGKKRQEIIKATYDIPELISKARSDFEESYYDSPLQVIRYVDLLTLESNCGQALNILEDSYEDHFRNNPVFEPIYLYKTGLLLVDNINYFLDETGTRYIKDTQPLKEAKERFQTLVDKYENSDLVKSAVYKIIEIDSEHLFDWNNVREQAEFLVDEYPDSEEADKARAIMEKYGWE